VYPPRSFIALPGRCSSPSDNVDAGGRVIHIQDGVSCDVPGKGGFLSEDEIVTQTSARTFAVFNPACEPKRDWQSSEGGWIIDISTERASIFEYWEDSTAQTAIVTDSQGNISPLAERW
jgi:hypothetical protein